MYGICNGKIILPDRIVDDGVLLFDTAIRGIVSEAEAASLCSEIYDAKGNYVSPGFVDVHVHAYLGEDASDGSSNGIRTISEGILKNGVTSYCPTTMTVSLDEIRASFEVCRSLKEESRTWNGAEILGVHAEGPFINPAKKGAQAEEHILPPDASLILEYADVISLVTVAPEMDGAEEFIRSVRKKTDVEISIGHTSATYDETKRAVEWGASHATHTFNAMVGIHHRDPGTVGGVLTSPEVYCELIADTFHVHPGLFSMMYKLKGDHLVVITDCIRAGGLSEGEYTLGGQAVTVKGIECRLADGTIAGSVLKMNKALKNFVENTDLPLWEAVNLVSRNPANSVNAHSKGTLEAGKDADIVLFDDSFDVVSVFKLGEKKF